MKTLNALFVISFLLMRGSLARSMEQAPPSAPPPADSRETYSHFLNAQLLERRGSFAQAVKEYSRTLETDPSATLVYRLRADLHLKMGNPEQALADALAYVKSRPDELDARMMLSNIYLMTGKSKEAKETLIQILKTSPDHIEALTALGTLLMAEEPAEAIQIFEHLLALQPTSTETLYNMGILYQQLGNEAMAKKMFERVIGMDQHSLPSLFLMGQMSESSGDTDAAIRNYEEALEKMPENFSLRMQLVLLHAQKKQPEDILRLLGQYRDDASSPVEANLWLGTVAESKKDWKEALKYYERALKQGDSTEIRIRLASIYTQMNETKKAVQSLELIARKNPDNPQYRYFLGLAYMDLKKFPKAVREFEKTVALNPDMSSAYFQMGVAYDSMKQWEKAEPMLKKAVQVDTENATASNYLGYTLAERNERLDEARRYIGRALEIDPNNPAYLDSIGWLNFREGNYAYALQFLESAARAMPDPIVYEHIGDCRLALEHFSEASLAYEKSLELNPAGKNVRKKLESLFEKLVAASPARKLLKKQEYALCRAADISGLLIFKNRARLASIFMPGTAQGFFYIRKESGVDPSSAACSTLLRVDLLNDAMMPSATLRFRDHPLLKWNVFPPELTGQMPAETPLILEAVASIFNGSALRALDSPETAVTERFSEYLLKNGKRECEIEKKRGLIRRLSSEDRTIEIEEYVLIDQVWLPRKITYSCPGAFKGKTIRVSLGIEFSGLSFKKIDNKLFEVKGE